MPCTCNCVPASSTAATSLDCTCLNLGNTRAVPDPVTKNKLLNSEDEQIALFMDSAPCTHDQLFLWKKLLDPLPEFRDVVFVLQV